MKKYIPLFDEYSRINELSSGMKAAAKFEASRKYGRSNAKTMYSNIMSSGDYDVIYEDESIQVTVKADGQRDLSVNFDKSMKSVRIIYIIKPYNESTGNYQYTEANCIAVTDKIYNKYVKEFSDDITIEYFADEYLKYPTNQIMPKLIQNRNALMAIINDINESTGLNLTWKEFISGIGSNGGKMELSVGGEQDVVSECRVNESYEDVMASIINGIGKLCQDLMLYYDQINKNVGISRDISNQFNRLSSGNVSSLGQVLQNIGNKIDI